MTTPAPGATLSLATDKATYNVGDTIVVTATYSDGTTALVSLVISATATDDSGVSVSAETTVSVSESEQQSMNVTVTDSFGDAYAQVSAEPGQAVFSAVIGTPPASA